MKILQLCKKFPYPLKDGESIAVSSLSKALHNLGCEISLLSMNTSKHFTDINALPADYDQYKKIYTVEHDNKINPWDAVRNLFGKRSFHISRYDSEAYRAELKKVLKKESFDIIQLETLYMTPYIEDIRAETDALIVLRAHNIESEIWRRLSQNAKFLPLKFYLQHLTDRLEEYELSHLNDYDYIVAVSDRDLKKFKTMGYQNGAMVSPIGIDLNKYDLQNSETFDIGFIGSMDWKPNEEGLEWFCTEVFPIIQKNIPSAKLHIAGRNTQASTFIPDNNNVVMHGEVESAQDFMAKCKVMIVPLFSGSGTRVKIIEAMALKKPIVTTSLGVEGIEAQDQKEVWIHDEPNSFATAVVDLLENQSLRIQTAESAFKFAKETYCSEENAKHLLQTYRKLLLKYAGSNKPVEVS